MKREVIGWTCYDHDDFLPLEHHDFPEAYEALKQEIKAKGYLFSSQMHQEESSGVPVFDNYRLLRLSQTAFARMMCDVYSGADTLRYRDSRFIQNAKLPPNSFRSACSSSTVFPVDLIADAQEQMRPKAKTDETFYLALPCPEKPIYWPSNILLLSYGNNDLFGVRVLKIFAFNNLNEYQDYEGRYHFGIAEKILNIYFKNAPFLVLKVQFLDFLPPFLMQCTRLLKLAKKNLTLANVNFDVESLTFDFCPKGLLPCRDSFKCSLVQTGEVAVGAMYTELQAPENKEDAARILGKIRDRCPMLIVDEEDTKLVIRTTGFIVSESDDWFLAFQKEVLQFLDAEFWGLFHHLQGLSVR